MPGGLDVLIEPKVRAILKTLQKSPGKLLHLNSLAVSSGVPVTSTSRLVKILVKGGFVEDVKIGKWSVYQLSKEKTVHNKSNLSLIEPKIKAILKTLQKSPGKLFHLNSLAQSSGVSVSSTARIIGKLVKIGFAEEMKVGNWSVYKLARNKQTEDLRKIL